MACGAIFQGFWYHPGLGSEAKMPRWKKTKKKQNKNQKTWNRTEENILPQIYFALFYFILKPHCEGMLDP